MTLVRAAARRCARSGSESTANLVHVVSTPALRGYVLEEMLAALLKSSGYDLIVDEKQDPDALVISGNGLRIHGRGADHQVDVLGQLRIRIPFMHRLRLFLEAKYREAPTGLSDLRNALGVINDVNEYYSANGTGVGSRGPRYQYRYALFSASGFTANAQRYAITHQISLIDLSGPEFSWILGLVDRFTAQFQGLSDRDPEAPYPVARIREILRRALGTWPDPEGGREGTFADAAEFAMSGSDAGSTRLPWGDVARIASEAAEAVDEGRLYLAFTDAPFILLLQADEPEEAQEFLGSPRAIRAVGRLRFAGASTMAGSWVISTDEPGQPLNFRVALPPDFEPVVFSGEGYRADNLGDRTDDRVVTIAINDNQAQLMFQPIAESDEGRHASEPRSQTNSDSFDEAVRQRTYRRAVALAPALTFVPEGDMAQALWSPDAVKELLSRLRREGWPQAAIIEFAAQHGGSVTREQVYELARYPSERMLRGFTRPPNRIKRALVREGILVPNAASPLVTHYSSGVLASHFTVPPEFRNYLER